MKVSEIFEKIKDLDNIIELHYEKETETLDAHWDIIIDLLQEYRDELMNKKVV